MQTFVAVLEQRNVFGRVPLPVLLAGALCVLATAVASYVALTRKMPGLWPAGRVALSAIAAVGSAVALASWWLSIDQARRAQRRRAERDSVAAVELVRATARPRARWPSRRADGALARSSFASTWSTAAAATGGARLAALEVGDTLPAGERVCLTTIDPAGPCPACQEPFESYEPSEASEASAAAEIAEANAAMRREHRRTHVEFTERGIAAYRRWRSRIDLACNAAHPVDPAHPVRAGSSKSQPRTGSTGCTG